MDDSTDMGLLRQYAERNSDTAFAALVSRHVNLVFSAALRKTGNPAAAEEITQAVFVILAQKAGRISAKTILPGWLYQTARLTAASFLKSEGRRARREQEAYMQTELPPALSDETWRQLAPLLEDAMGHLDDKERSAVLLRFFDGKSFAEVATATGVTENAATKRVTRALEKLRRYFSRRGVSSTTAIIAGAISANSVQVAPAALAKTVTAAAVAKGAAASSSTLTLIKGALKIMAWTKAKTTLVVGAGILLAAGATTLVVKTVAHPKPLPTDVSWMDDPRYWKSDSRVLDQLPPVMLIRPANLKFEGGGVTSGNRIMFKNITLDSMIDCAYDFGASRSIFPDGMPPEHYDLMFTLGNEKILQQELARRFGYAAHTETRTSDVLFLKVQNRNPPNLKPAHDAFSSRMFTDADKTVIEGQDISALRQYIEGVVGMPVLDQTGMKGKYDVTLEMNLNWRTPSREKLEQTLLDQLGLELVPTRKPVRLLVVEKTK
jgi:uncharacterized protein (TIGR03435 family)